VIEIVELCKRYGSFAAVTGLSLRVESGEIVGLVGPNGAGKTTTLRCLCGIIPPSEGSIRLAGHDLATSPIPAKRALAFVPDEPKLFDTLTVDDHMTLVGRLYEVDDAAERAATLLDELGLADRRRSFPAELSRGMKQKLLVAMALVHRPRVLVLDEPLTGLDPAAMRAMKARIRRTAEEGAAILLSSHMLHLVEELCTRLVILARGESVLEGSLAEIRAQEAALGRSDELEEIFMRATGLGEEDSAP
jgi:ABC-2 type transport system ATP-binding protein